LEFAEELAAEDAVGGFMGKGKTGGNESAPPPVKQGEKREGVLKKRASARPFCFRPRQLLVAPKPPKSPNHHTTPPSITNPHHAPPP